MWGRWGRSRVMTVMGAATILSGAAAAFAGTTTPVSVDVCADCHEEYVESYLQGPHSLFERGDWSLPEGVRSSCEACHGDATDHIEEGGGEGGVVAFGGSLPGTATGTCLTCHGDTHPGYRQSAHAQAGLSCVDCHAVHELGSPEMAEETVGARLAGITGASGTCFSCHQGAFTDFEFNERHRLQEGILECSSCHDPHESSTRALLGGFRQEACVSCHADKGGPFVFEHASSRVEGCTACHSPHGSPNRHQLAFQDVAQLCYSCHSEVPSFHIGFGGPVRFDFSTQCTNCHSSIHGSNLHPAFLQ